MNLQHTPFISWPPWHPLVTLLCSLLSVYIARRKPLYSCVLSQGRWVVNVWLLLPLECSIVYYSPPVCIYSPYEGYCDPSFSPFLSLISFLSRHQLTDWLDILKTSLRLTEHSSPSPSTSPSPPLLSSRSSHSLPLCLSLRAPKQKALKRDCRNGRIDEEEPSIVLTRAIVTKQDCTDSRIARQPVSGSDPANGEINHLTLAS